eukprot:GHVU01038453.1.p1 GENE.GHVU01038453.1~~GHVU01038453.1.p1  ORF type:complete len:247 (-),score=25.05 GHVU01038453.1:241-981(-)
MCLYLCGCVPLSLHPLHCRLIALQLARQSSVPTTTEQPPDGDGTQADADTQLPELPRAKMTRARLEVYLRSLEGAGGQRRETLSAIRKKYVSIHIAQWVPLDAALTCSCKMWMHQLQCPHTLLLQHNLKQINLNALLAPVQAVPLCRLPAAASSQSAAAAGRPTSASVGSRVAHPQVVHGVPPPPIDAGRDVTATAACVPAAPTATAGAAAVGGAGEAAVTVPASSQNRVGTRGYVRAMASQHGSG